MSEKAFSVGKSFVTDLASWLPHFARTQPQLEVTLGFAFVLVQKFAAGISFHAVLTI